MATWQEVKNVVFSTFAQNGMNGDNCVVFMKEFEGARPAQPGIIMKVGSTADECVNISSPIRNLSVAQLDTALEFLGNYFYGGLTKLESVGYLVRETRPLATPVEELAKLMVLVPTIAGDLEEALSSGAAN